MESWNGERDRRVAVAQEAERSEAMSENLMDGLFREMNRCREVLKNYEAVGPVGRFGYALISANIKESEVAIASNDVVRMIAAFKALQGCE